MSLLYVALAGGAGAVARWLVDLAAAARFGRALPVGTMVVNVLGSLLAGALAGATLGTDLGATWTRVLAVGLCGGFTTFSAASFDVARELERRRPALGLVVLLGPMALAVAGGVGAFVLAGG